MPFALKKSFVLQLMAFRLTEDEIWQIWPNDETIGAFASGTANTALPDIVKNYFDRLGKEINHLMMSINQVRTEFEDVMATLVENLDKYQKSVQIDETFFM